MTSLRVKRLVQTWEESPGIANFSTYDWLICLPSAFLSLEEVCFSEPAKSGPSVSLCTFWRFQPRTDDGQCTDSSSFVISSRRFWSLIPIQAPGTRLNCLCSSISLFYADDQRRRTIRKTQWLRELLEFQSVAPTLLFSSPDLNSLRTSSSVLTAASVNPLMVTPFLVSLKWSSWPWLGWRRSKIVSL